MLCFMVKLLTLEFIRILFWFPFLFPLSFQASTYFSVCHHQLVDYIKISNKENWIHSPLVLNVFLGHLTTVLKSDLQKQCSVPLSFHDSKAAPQGVNCFPPPTKPTADQLSPYSHKFCIRNSKLRSPVG